jgi:hypothetical protein
MQQNIAKCWCGRPLHYKSPKEKQMVDEIVNKFGEFINVTVAGSKTYLVQRHYIALHGIKDKDLSTLGFAEVNPKLA